MSVRARLGLTFLVLMALFLVPMRYAGARLNDLRELAVEQRSQHAAATLALGGFRAGLANFDSRQRSYLVTLDARMARQVDESVEDLETQLARLLGAGYGNVAGGLVAELDSVITLSGRVDALLQVGRVDSATAVFQAMTPLRTNMETELREIAAAVDRESEADFARAEEMSSTAATTTIVATLAAVLLAILVSLWTTGALTGPLGTLSTAAARVADGTFEEPEELPYERSDEIGDLSRSFRAMTRRLAELDRMKAEFMSVASHELKTPISVIRGYTELIQEDAGDELDEREIVLLDAIAEQADAMSRLASRLLDIGRLEAGTYRMEIERVHIDDLVAGLARSFGVLAGEHGVQLRTEVEDSAPATFYADPDMLQNEVLGNLVSNALRFTPREGEVSVRVWREGDDIVFEVSDTGPGIPVDQRPNIFKKYYEGERTQSMGSGLGLAVAKQVVEAHGGRINLEPDIGIGATFRVYLPADPIRTPALNT